MADAIQFETPENVQISYQPAGLGHRFIAWLLDQILVWTLCIVFTIILVLVAASGVAGEILESIGDTIEDAETDQQAGEQLLYYLMGIGLLVWSFSSLVYFGASELFLRGQTLGKRLISLRVVKANGFSLDPISIFVRNFFRIVDHISPLWIVPVLSKRGQRFGDMVAGTVVVSDKPAPLSLVRQELAERTAVDAKYRFDASSLARLRHTDFEAVELLLDRWDDLPRTQLVEFLDTLIDPLAQRLRMEAPPMDDRLRFLEDLLAAEYRRQSRSLA